MNLTVLGPHVFIRPAKLPNITENSGLFLVHDQSDSTMKGTVVAVGEGPEFVQRAVNKALEEVGVDWYAPTYDHLVTVGDTVIFSPERGEELIFDQDILVCIREDDILAVIDP